MAGQLSDRESRGDCLRNSVTDKTGFVVEQGDVKGLLEAVRRIAERGKVQYTADCRAYALANFRKEDRYADYLKLYENITVR